MTKRIGGMAAAALVAVATASGSMAHADDPDEVTLVVVGDTGFARNGARVYADGIHGGKRVATWAALTAGVAPLIDGHLNFMNVETVVTDRNNLRPDSKGQKAPFLFRSHSASIRHLVKLGFNLASLANNHSSDYGDDGVLDSLEHLEAMKADGLLAYAGTGANRDEATAPKVVAVRGAKIGFAALGIVTNNLRRHRAGPNKPGSAAYRFDDDWKLVTKRLADAAADYRILSIHYGYERIVETDKKQRSEWRWAARDRGIDLVVGHHAHVARGVERNGNSIIFYGLGNFLHTGTKNMGGVGKFRLCRDFGVLGRVFLRRQPNGKLMPRAVQVVPIYATHRIAHPFVDPAEGRRRVEVLNYHARKLDNAKAGAEGMRFRPQADGTGLYCFAGADTEGGRAGALCKGWTPAPPLGANKLKEIAGRCHARHIKK